MHDSDSTILNKTGFSANFNVIQYKVDDTTSLNDLHNLIINKYNSLYPGENFISHKIYKNNTIIECEMSLNGNKYYVTQKLFKEQNSILAYAITFVFPYSYQKKYTKIVNNAFGTFKTIDESNGKHHIIDFNIFLNDQIVQAPSINKVSVKLETTNGELEIFNHNKIEIPKSIDFTSINSIVVSFDDYTLSFYERPSPEKIEREKDNPVLSLLNKMDYENLIKSEQNWYLYLDTYPFKNNSENIIAENMINSEGGTVQDYLVMTLKITNYESKV
ncbi:hypothetical protein [Aureibacter tunicatorum]|uniref:Uncharacterized protein n=1 Tax=Aureibacter tunicatorum TaxID=866807 RepID=A0AAE3XQ72_9BACT|nr:hypothetical protein [Aureibacter tunicatorum]MDR6241112.1 hypothetical protein [Aureibacter tunicatorum]BDD03890.1 hypothetical protein AUTU_13730 [Aureibacter tunicatorum]